MITENSTKGTFALELSEQSRYEYSKMYRGFGLMLSLVSAFLIATSILKGSEPARESKADVELKRYSDELLTREPIYQLVVIAIASLSERLPPTRDLSETTYRWPTRRVNIYPNDTAMVQTIDSVWTALYPSCKTDCRTQLRQASTEHNARIVLRKGSKLLDIYLDKKDGDWVCDCWVKLDAGLKELLWSFILQIEQ